MAIMRVYEWALYFLKIKGYIMLVWKVFTMILFPAVLLARPRLIGRLICMNYAKTPRASPSDPEGAGLDNVQRFEVPVPTDDESLMDGPQGGQASERDGNSDLVNLNAVGGGRLAAWHVAPIMSGPAESGWRDGRPVIIYCHGSFGTRAEPYRIRLYKILAKKYHVITFDYRGFGDSSVPNYVTEVTMVNDAYNMYHFVRSQGGSTVFLWGHGLASGIVAHVASKMAAEGDSSLTGVILSGAFFNLSDLTKTHKWFVYAGLPFYEPLILNSLKEAGFHMESSQHVVEMIAPLAIIHADDDSFVPFASAFRLYEMSKHRSNAGLRQFYGFLGKRGMNHHNLDAAGGELLMAVDRFVIKSASKPKSANRQPDRASFDMLDEYIETGLKKEEKDSIVFLQTKTSVQQRFPGVYIRTSEESLPESSNFTAAEKRERMAQQQQQQQQQQRQGVFPRPNQSSNVNRVLRSATNRR